MILLYRFKFSINIEKYIQDFRKDNPNLYKDKYLSLKELLDDLMPNNNIKFFKYKLY
jgi:hypothetical protein